MYNVFLSPQAKKDLKRLPKHYETAIILSLRELRESPGIGKPLTKELAGKFSYKIGMYRIIYVINEQNKTVNILSAGYRGTVYQ